MSRVNDVEASNCHVADGADCSEARVGTGRVPQPGSGSVPPQPVSVDLIVLVGGVVCGSVSAA